MLGSMPFILHNNEAFVFVICLYFRAAVVHVVDFRNVALAHSRPLADRHPWRRDDCVHVGVDGEAPRRVMHN